MVDNMDDLSNRMRRINKAIDSFDLSHNVKFSTYAVPLILGGNKKIFKR